MYDSGTGYQRDTRRLLTVVYGLCVHRAPARAAGNKQPAQGEPGAEVKKRVMRAKKPKLDLALLKVSPSSFAGHDALHGVGQRHGCHRCSDLAHLRFVPLLHACRCPHCPS